jgi:2-polyprenyl-6-methoxyphenol hydroxylase-like FAD-dependent oxidoreductase
VTRIGIVGAGIGGLAAANALRNRGHEVVVFERSPEPRTVGGGLHLWSNAIRALREIGLGGAIEDVAVEVHREQILTSSGRLLVEWDVAGASREIRAPSVGLTRPSLLRALLDGLDGDTEQFGRKLTAFAEDGAGVTVSFDDGEQERVDLLVGAAGNYSKVRAQLHGVSEPRFRGYEAWRTLIPADPGLAPPGVLAQYWGRGARLVYFPAGRDSIYFVCLLNARRGEAGASEPKAYLQERFKHFADPVGDLIAAASDSGLHRTEIADRNPIRRWGRGRVTLLGDSAHPMTPNTSQGAGMALEDAAVLARVLTGASDPVAALRDYERQRWKRTAEQILMARFPGTLGTLHGSLACTLRDKYIDLTFGGPVWRKQKKILAANF